jgi:hypothetical protein
MYVYKWDLSYEDFLQGDKVLWYITSNISKNITTYFVKNSFIFSREEDWDEKQLLVRVAMNKLKEHNKSLDDITLFWYNFIEEVKKLLPSNI